MAAVSSMWQSKALSIALGRKRRNGLAPIIPLDRMLSLVLVSPLSAHLLSVQQRSMSPFQETLFEKLSPCRGKLTPSIALRNRLSVHSEIPRAKYNTAALPIDGGPGESAQVCAQNPNKSE